MGNGSTISEDLIAEQLRTGDDKAFRHIMNRYFPIITLFALRLVGHRPAAEDIAEETFIKLWHHHSNVGNFQSIKAFLYITAKNACLNERRSAHNLARRHEGFTAGQMEQPEWIDRQIVRAEVEMEILRAVDELPEKMRRVFQLGFLEGLPNREIARELDARYILRPLIIRDFPCLLRLLLPLLAKSCYKSGTMISKTCKHWGQEFTAKTVRTRYCCHACNRKGYKKAEWDINHSLSGI